MNKELIAEIKKQHKTNKKVKETFTKIELEKSSLPNFVKEQMKIIDSLQQRVNQLNKDFEIEKNCKNQVYYFILENGYFNEYKEYNRKNPIQ